MNVNDAVKRLDDIESKMRAYNHATGLLYYDGATGAPKKSAAERGETMAVLSEEIYKLGVSDEYRDIIYFINEHKDEVSPAAARRAELLIREYERISRIPMQEYVEFTRLKNEAEDVWHRAKADNDYASFGGYIDRIVYMMKQFAAYFDADKDPYDVWLDQFERGLSREKLDAFFSALRSEIVPLLKRVTEKGSIDVAAAFERSYPVELQRVFSGRVMDYMAIDKGYCTLAETEHPFTIEFSKHDVRITTNYHEDSVVSSMYSVVHEGGHALYELNMDDSLAATCLSGGVSTGIHESQSRLYENMIGRSRAFCRVMAPIMREVFPGLFDADAEQLYTAVNIAKPSLIRIEADELTYCLHIMVRYELEKELFDGVVDAEGLPAAWNEKMREYLGVCPEKDSEGVLQDSHWGGALFGYFPSYAIGSAYAAQIVDRMKKDLDVDAEIESGSLENINAWLREHIFRFGSMYDPQELFERCCGAPFDPKYYTDYLKNKFTEIYGL